MQTLGTPPLARAIPVTKGCGFTFTITQTDPTTGAPAPFDGTVQMNIDYPTPATVTATIATNIATIVLTPTLCDQADFMTRYRVINTLTGGTDIPLLVGGFQRYD